MAASCVLRRLFTSDLLVEKSAIGSGYLSWGCYSAALSIFTDEQKLPRIESALYVKIEDRVCAKHTGVKSLLEMSIVNE
jgi:hypothetical protein